MTPAALKAFLDGDLGNAIAASTPGGIEVMEKDGQTKLVRHPNRLPVDGTIGGRQGDKRKQWEAAGFVFGDVPPSDRSYFAIKAPPRAASYRVSLQTFSWRSYGAGGG